MLDAFESLFCLFGSWELFSFATVGPVWAVWGTGTLPTTDPLAAAQARTEQDLVGGFQVCSTDLTPLLGV